MRINKTPLVPPNITKWIGLLVSTINFARSPLLIWRKLSAENNWNVFQSSPAPRRDDAPAMIARQPAMKKALL